MRFKRCANVEMRIFSSKLVKTPATVNDEAVAFLKFFGNYSNGFTFGLACTD